MKGSYTVIALCVYLSIHIGDALQCYSCDGFCTSMSEVNCTMNEMCFSIEKLLGESQAKTKGCLAEERCNTTVGEAARKCCNTDRCNSGTVPGAFSAIFYTVLLISSCIFIL